MPPAGADPHSAGPLAAAGVSGDVLLRFGVLTGLWWILTDGNIKSWGFGIVAVTLSLVTSLILLPAGLFRFHPIAVLRFAAFYARASLLGGIDVARRVLDPALPVDPGFVRYPIRLTIEPARLIFVQAISLIPGSLGVELGEGEVLLHVLDRESRYLESLHETERRVADLFGVTIDPDEPPDGGTSDAWLAAP